MSIFINDKEVSRKKIRRQFRKEAKKFAKDLKKNFEKRVDEQQEELVDETIKQIIDSKIASYLFDECNFDYRELGHSTTVSVTMSPKAKGQKGEMKEQ